ncbi:PWI domain mRNA processing protein, putative [Cordyceps militaris CM01]|uniref:PWI domain mRNA processing protein, putative n=1 Tax=Cordyceps militaris (strain CM01) TaxID=983644 RepID=G3JJ88_CORMM|nr:PWI domain mRNA processing protein, putative [Cordyceps militaris CM01]EGX92030.1 PWI domain mRNA processing protein, putative [Cordyceps militaris CM01]
MASRTDARLLKATKFPPEFNKKVDMQKVNLGVMKKWIASRISEILGNEDDVVIEMCFNLVDGPRNPDIKALQIQLTGFLDKDTASFCKELWKLFLSAQDSPQGVPKELLEAKKLELMQEKVESAETNPSDATATYCLPTIGTEETDREIGRIIDRDAGVTVASTIAEPTIAEPTVAQSKVVEALDLRRDRVLLRRGETADNGAHTTATAMYHEDGMDHSVDEMDHSVEEMDHSVVEMDHSGDETADRSAPHPLRLLDLALRRAAARALHPDAETRPDAETHPDVVLRYESDQGLDPAHPNATRIVLADLETEANHLLPKGRGRTQEAGPGPQRQPEPEPEPEPKSKPDQGAEE